ncbi:MAG TPA: hypothetical protein PKO44_01710 [Candidatus Omnitrophota bacterium]|nr:hypothetical protein [Candidatus Omnitrophota bacterium]
MSSFLRHIIHFFFLRVSFLKFILPFGLWLILFYPIVLGRITIVGDTCSFYATVKFFTDNLAQGVFALWTPFLFWGFPTLAEFQYFGPFNPMWLLILIFQKIGISFYFAFLWTYLGYFFIGQIGFYYLAKAILKDNLVAYIAFLVSLFSFTSMIIFNSPNSVFIGVPMAWFFYFLVRFWQSFEKRFFVGLVFTMMIIVGCYLPFYWWTVFFLVCFLYCVFYREKLASNARAIRLFLKHRWRLVIVCCLALGLAAAVSLKGYSIMRAGDVLALDRKIAGDDVYQGGINVAYEKIAALCVTAQTTFRQMFFRLDDLSVCFGPRYLSIFVFCVLALGSWVCITRKSFILFLLTTVLFFVALGDQTPLCKSFFYYFPFFKMIHGVGSFYGIIGPLLILFMAMQLKFILKQKMDMPRYRGLAVVFFVHLGIWLLLRRQPMIATTHVAILLSALFFSLVVLGKLSYKPIWFLLLIAGVVVQPVEVFWKLHEALEHMDVNKDRIIQNCSYPSTSPMFSFTRPELVEDFDVYDAHRAYIQMKDASGFPLTAAGYPPKWSYDLKKHFPLHTVSQYTKYKFHLYDHIRFVSDDSFYFQQASKFPSLTNLAFISAESNNSEEGLRKLSLSSDTSLKRDLTAAITGPSEQFDILSFSVNTIKIRTHFLQHKFLVYTDSFQPGWRASVNGKAVALYRANLAFKGIFLPAGENVVIFDYKPFGGQAFYFFILSMHVGFLCYLIFLLVHRNKETAP